MEANGNDTGSFQSFPISYSLGTGHGILTQTCDPILKSVKNELIFVTCFWAESSSRQYLCDLLHQLSDRATSSADPLSRITVRICFSSSSIIQKLLHTSSPQGHIYDPRKEWKQKLGLPPPSELPGLDMQVKSVFVKPFSVMHPKFIIVDRRICMVPSCNVSWERWFEGCLVSCGAIVKDLFEFYSAFWDIGLTTFHVPRFSPITTVSKEYLHGFMRLGQVDEAGRSSSALPRTQYLADPLPNHFTSVKMFLLRHSYHRNPNFRPFPCQAAPPAPDSELNKYTVQFLSSAKRSLFLTTPNLTAGPVLTQLKGALSRGVKVCIITNERLMRLEQIVTAGTTTPRCIKKLVQWHRRLRLNQTKNDNTDLESGVSIKRLGSLSILYFHSRMDRILPDNKDETEPDHLHLKMTVCDDQVMLVGSGNMDRASWYTSQELGLAVSDANIATKVSMDVQETLRRRLKTVYEG